MVILFYLPLWPHTSTPSFAVNFHDSAMVNGMIYWATVMIYCYEYGLIIQPFMVGNLLQYDVHVGNKVIVDMWTY